MDKGTVQDRYGNIIYITQERWEHILESRPELEPYFAFLSEQTEYWPRSFSLDKLDKLPEDLRELVLSLLTSLPVSQFLKLSQLQISSLKHLPVAYVESQPMAVYA